MILLSSQIIIQKIFFFKRERHSKDKQGNDIYIWFQVFPHEIQVDYLLLRYRNKQKEGEQHHVLNTFFFFLAHK